MAQARDLEERKARTSEFKASRSTDLSVADSSLLSISKSKTEEKQKERETLGYYREWSDKTPAAEDEKKDWKVEGKVLTTQGQATNTKTWEAENEEKMTTSEYQQEKALPIETTLSTETAMCGCGCVIS